MNNHCHMRDFLKTPQTPRDYRPEDILLLDIYGFRVRIHHISGEVVSPVTIHRVNRHEPEKLSPVYVGRVDTVNDAVSWIEEYYIRDGVPPSSPRDLVKKDELCKLFEHYKDLISTVVLTIKDVEMGDAAHLINLCDEAILKYDEFFCLDGDNSKINRWLGYIQGILIANGITTVQEERDFTRPYLTKHRTGGVK